MNYYSMKDRTEQPNRRNKPLHASHRMKIPLSVLHQFQKWSPEILKARERILTTPNGNGQESRNNPRAAAMRWAINLAWAEIDKLSEGDFSNLQYEIDWFRRVDIEAPFIEPILEFQDKELGPPPLSAKESIGKVQTWFRESLSTIAQRNPDEPGVSFQAPATIHRLSWIASHQRWVSPIDAFRQDAGEPQLCSALFFLLKHHAEDIRTCPCGDCQHIFLRDRRNQEFCSKRCQERQAKRIELEIPPERYGKRGRPPRQSPKPRSNARIRTKGGKHATKR